MGMFDNYNPKPSLDCPKCGATLDGWQGKDGPSLLFRWEQGKKHPDDEMQVAEVNMETYTLPESFEIYTSCSKCKLWVEAHCTGKKYIWTNTDIKNQTS